eukprot:7570229-Prorocentrum_lima.AAC.1
MTWTSGDSLAAYQQQTQDCIVPPGAVTNHCVLHLQCARGHIRLVCEPIVEPSACWSAHH